MLREKVLSTALALAIVLAGLIIGEAQITVPHTFSTTVPVSQLNTNFSTIADGALKRSGGNLTGNITADSGVTIDGVDVSAALGGSGTGAFANVTTSSTGATSIDAAGGITAGTGNVGIVDTSGRIPAISSTYFASLNGANLTSIPAATGLTTSWATPTYAAGDYTTNGAGGWTVDAGDVGVFSYSEIGKTMFITVQLTATDPVAATGSELRVKVPNSRTIGANGRGIFTHGQTGTYATGLWVATIGNQYISFLVSPAGAAWTDTTSATEIYASIVIAFQ